MEYNTIAYQTLIDKDNADEVEKNGPFKSTRETAWLYHGYYFWDDDYQRALDWGKDYDGGCIIIKCKLFLENVLDLVGTPRCQREFRELIKILEEKHPKKNEIRKSSLSKIIKTLLDYNNNKKGIFAYDSIRAQDHPNRENIYFFTEKENEYMDLNPRIQICLFKKRIVNLPDGVKIVHPKKYVLD